MSFGRIYCFVILFLNEIFLYYGISKNVFELERKKRLFLEWFNLILCENYVVLIFYNIWLVFFNINFYEFIDCWLKLFIFFW